jgi:DNA-binding LacI/PurR family transcriptional regulator
VTGASDTSSDPAPRAAGPHPKSRGAARRAQRSGPTLEDVAAVAGVSRGTVSRLLNGGTYVSVQAKDAVQRAIAETGYVVNHSARSLVTRRTNYAAVVLSEPQERLFEDPNLPVLLRVLGQHLADLQLTMVLLFAGSDPERRNVLEFLRGGHVDGALLLSAHGGDLILQGATDCPVPIVACGQPIGYEDVLTWAAADDRAGARQITQHLVERGCRRIAMITGPLDTPGGSERLAGFRDVLGDRALPALIVEGDYSRQSGEAAMASLLARAPDLDAVFAASDLMAAGALAALATAGRRIPEDVAVVGFDDSAVAAVTTPPLTTVRQPLAQIAASMVAMLADRIAGRPVTSPAVFPTEIVHRSSA